MQWRRFGRIVAAVGLVALLPQDAGAPRLPDLALLRRGLQDGSFGAMGEIGAQYAGMTLSDPRFEPYSRWPRNWTWPWASIPASAFPGSRTPRAAATSGRPTASSR